MDHGRSSATEELLKRLDALERRTGELEQLVVEKDAIIAAQRAQIESLQSALERAEEQIALFKKTLFAPRRERYVASPARYVGGGESGARRCEFTAETAAQVAAEVRDPRLSAGPP